MLEQSQIPVGELDTPNNLRKKFAYATSGFHMYNSINERNWNFICKDLPPEVDIRYDQKHRTIEDLSNIISNIDTVLLQRTTSAFFFSTLHDSCHDNGSKLAILYLLLPPALTAGWATASNSEDPNRNTQAAVFAGITYAISILLLCCLILPLKGWNGFKNDTNLLKELKTAAIEYRLGLQNVSSSQLEASAEHQSPSFGAQRGSQ